MNEYLLKLDEALKPFLQKNIRFIINSQPYKEGKFILYTHGYFCLNIDIKNYRKNKTEILKIPLPFKFESHVEDELLYFDYRIKSFILEHKDLDAEIKSIKSSTLSRYYDKVLTIEVLK